MSNIVPPSVEKQINGLSAMLQFQMLTRKASSQLELAFVAVNDSASLLDFDQAVIWRKSSSGAAVIEAVSGVSEIDSTAPNITALQDYFRWRKQQPDRGQISSSALSCVPEKLRGGLDQWLPENLLWVPFASSDAGIFLSRKQPWNEQETAIAEHMAEALNFAWTALGKVQGRLGQRLISFVLRRWVIVGFATLALCSLFYPVNLNVLAPAEVVPSLPTRVNAPLDGVIDDVLVEPNQWVEKGQALLRFDDTDLRNKEAVSQQMLKVALARLDAGSKRAFGDKKSQAQLKILQAEVTEKEAELTFAMELMQRVTVLAKAKGLVVFSEKNDWIGQPVQVGMQVLQIADPEHVEIRMELAVEDHIPLENGAPIKLFLNIDPLNPLVGELYHASYEAEVSETGTLSYILRGKFSEHTTSPRIGTRGTARIVGDRVTLFYLLFRRPIASIRKTFGL